MNSAGQREAGASVSALPPRDAHGEAAERAGVAAARALRARIRRDEHRGLTTGLAPGQVQANLVVLPLDWAAEFETYCRANAKACPLLAVSQPGDPRLAALGEGIDVRSDLPCYRVFRDGRVVDEVSDIGALWCDDLVAFALGCSYSFEWALLQAGIPVRHLEMGSKVCAYRSALDTVAAGRFRGKLVVSMRPFPVPDAIRAIEVTSRFPDVHGAPVHFGDPAAIGIDDLERPEFGGVPGLRDGDVPLFWACGITPQVALEFARPPLAITHKAGHMLITDRCNAELASG